MARQDSRVQKWVEWLDDVRRDIIRMNHDRRVYTAMVEIVNRHGSLPASSVFDFIRITYVTTQSVAIRRQAEVDSRVISLGTLLNEIANDPERLTRDWWIGIHDPDDRLYSERAWDESWFAGPSEHVDPRPVREDLRHLVAVSEKVNRYVDKHVAHRDRRPLEELPTFDDVNAAIDGFGHLFKKYAALLTASDWVTLVPVAQYNWLAVFLQPWIEDEAILFDLLHEPPFDQ